MSTLMTGVNPTGSLSAPIYLSMGKSSRHTYLIHAEASSHLVRLHLTKQLQETERTTVEQCLLGVP